MEIIKYLATVLSKEISISPAGARGLLKLSIKDLFGPFYEMTKLTYIDLSSVIKNSLGKRLLDLEIKNTNEIISLLISELNKNQSLITIERI